jgi:MFS family permease
LSSIHPACDSAAACGDSGESAARPNLVLITTILASSLAFVDGSVVNVALPAIAKNLGADAGALQWIINIYLLPLSALLLLGGAMGDHFGRRRLLIGGTAIFAAASLGCALAPSLAFLFAARFLQGLGAAILLPNSLAILGQTFSGTSRGRAIGIWAATGAAMGAIGPVLGGWFIDLGSWRAIFLLNLPLAFGAIALGLAFVPGDRTQGAVPLDGVGAMLATVGLAALTWALTVGSGRTWTAAALAGAAVAVGFLAAFLRVELFVLIPYLLIKEAGYSGTAAGAALLPLPLILTVASPYAGALAGRIGPRLPLTIGPLVVAAGFLLAFRIQAKADYWSDVLPMILVIGLGMSAAVAPLTTAVLTSVDRKHTGSASGLNSAVARTGGLVATALLGSVLAAEGHQLLLAFRTAMMVGAAACMAASLAAFGLLGRATRK